MTTTTTLNIHNSSIRYLATSDDMITHWGTMSSKDILKNGIIQQPVTTGIRIKSLFESECLPDERVICSINGLPFSYRILTLPRLDAEAEDEAILRAARREMPAALEDMHLSWHAYPADNNEWKVFVTGITPAPLLSLVETLRYAHIKPYRLSLPYVALSQLVGRQNCIILDYERDYSSLILLAGGVPHAIHSVPPPGDGVTAEDRAAQLTRAAVNMIDFYNNSHPDDTVDESMKLVLTGEMAYSETTGYLLQGGMPFPLEILNPGIEVTSDLPVNTYAVNIGSAMLHDMPEKDKSGRPVPHRDIDLRKVTTGTDSIEKLKRTAVKMLLPLGVMFGTVSLILAFVFLAQANTDIENLESELVNASNRQTDIAESIDHALSLQNTIDGLALDLSAIEQKSLYFSNAAKYVNNLGLMMQAMPDNISFSSIELRENGMTLYGYAPNPQNIVDFAEKLESPGNFSEANVIWINTNEGQKAPDGSTNNRFLLMINK